MGSCHFRRGGHEGHEGEGKFPHGAVIVVGRDGGHAGEFVLKTVHGGAGFSGFSFGPGGFLGVALVGVALFFGRHCGYCSSVELWHGGLLV